MEPRNALVVGGQKRCWETVLLYLKSCGVQIYDHWTDEKYLDSKLPKSVEIVIIISTQVSHALEKHALAEAGKHGKIYVRTDHRFSKFPEQLRKWGIIPLDGTNLPTVQREAIPERDTPLVPIETISVPPPPTAAIVKLPIQPPPLAVSPDPRRPQKEEAPMPKMEEKTMKHQLRAQAKLEYLRTLLKENPFENPDSLNRKIASKYPGKHPSKPGGVSKALIAQVRMDECDIKIGPGGRPTNGKGERLDIPEKYQKMGEEVPEQRVERARPVVSAVPHYPSPPSPARQPKAEASPAASQDRLRQLMAQLRHVMESEGIDQLNIPLLGQIQVRRLQNFDL